MTELAIIKTEAKELTNKELKKEVIAYASAGESVGNARWKMARAIHNIVISNLFIEDFDTISEFGEFIGLKKSNISQLVSACQLIDMMSFNQDEWTVGKAYTLSTLSFEEREEFLVWSKLQGIDLPLMSDKALINLIKEWRASIEEFETEEAETEEAETEEAETEVEVMVIDENGNKYSVPASILEKYRI